MPQPLISPENYFSEDPLYYSDGFLNPEGFMQNNQLLEEHFRVLDSLFAMRSGPDQGALLSADVAERLLPTEATWKDAPFTRVANRIELTTAERILLLLILEAHYRPVAMTRRITSLLATNKNLVIDFGYFKDPFSAGYYPTIKTVLFLLAGNDIAHWRKLEQEILYHGRLLKEQIVIFRDPDERALMGNRMNHILSIEPEYVDYLLHGRKPRPDFGRSFPAKWVSTNLNWDNLVLNPRTMSEIHDVMDWVAHGEDVISRSEQQVNQSFPCLFYGPPGTGKSLTAKLIGKHYGKDVFRVDLSMIVSKYIGETEKNLAQLFDRAEGKDWILFFDEADSLFGKRTGISDSKDKWANLEMSYLLQRMEEHQGLCILATNLKNNLDAAMSRRVQASIYFPWPKEEERSLIWQKSVPPGFEYANNVSFEKLGKFDLSGAGIANVIKASCVKAAKRGDYILHSKDIARFIRIEYAKDSRTP